MARQEIMILKSHKLQATRYKLIHINLEPKKLRVSKFQKLNQSHPKRLRPQGLYFQTPQALVPVSLGKKRGFWDLSPAPDLEERTRLGLRKLRMGLNFNLRSNLKDKRAINKSLALLSRAKEGQT